MRKSRISAAGLYAEEHRVQGLMVECCSEVGQARGLLDLMLLWHLAPEILFICGTHSSEKTFLLSAGRISQMHDFKSEYEL